MIASTKRATQTVRENSLTGIHEASRKSRHGTDFLQRMNAEYPEGF
ncbi:MAG TPA: hypothetical protein VJY15_03130 [Candidatus Acidoferrum sp.]|nr:hypothetical protein [Candidatus Acidoferrum sp.]